MAMLIQTLIILSLVITTVFCDTTTSTRPYTRPATSSVPEQSTQGDHDSTDTETTSEEVVQYQTTQSGDPPEYKATRGPRGLDFMTKPDRLVLCQLVKELLMDAHMKAHKVIPVIDAHRPAMAFEVGHVIGLIRERYRRMMQIYREYIDKEHIPGKWARTKLLAAGIGEMRTLFALNVYERIHEIEWDIEKMVDLLKEIPRPLLGLNESTIKPPATGKQGKERKGGHTQPPAGRRSIREVERYKSRLREQFLLRKLGMDEKLSTTKKRFQLGWPVEDTWDNIQY